MKMTNLSTINISNPLFNERVLKVLSNNKIITVLDFLREDTEKLKTLMKLSLPQILNIRDEIFRKYSAPVANAKDLFILRSYKKKFLNTGIERLNKIIGGGIPLGSIIELCGLADSGKTQLCLHITINCANTTENNILYIDTKGDFSSTRIQKIMVSCGYSYKDMAIVMNKIKVVRVWNMMELIEIFQRLKHKHFIENLALIIVDSLPCLMFQHLGDDAKVGLSFLNTFVNNAKFLSKEFELSIVCVNIFTRWVEQDISETEELNADELSTVIESCWKETKSRCLGQYWAHIPALVLNMEKISESNFDENNTNIKIAVTKSVYGKCKESCFLQINSKGVS